VSVVMLAADSESTLTRIAVVTEVQEAGPGAALTNTTAATIMVAFVLKWKQDTGMSTSIMTANFIAAVKVSRTTWVVMTSISSLTMATRSGLVVGATGIVSRVTLNVRSGVSWANVSGFIVNRTRVSRTCASWASVRSVSQPDQGQPVQCKLN
jgi:hypothetical protein